MVYADQQPLAPSRDHLRKSLSVESSTAWPHYDERTHNNGEIEVTVTNKGEIGNLYWRPSKGFVFGGRIALWVGGVVDRDTLVSTGLGNFPAFNVDREDEMSPTGRPNGGITAHINRSDGMFYSRREDFLQKFTAVYYDTLTDRSIIPFSPLDQRFHKPLNLQITQTSYSWSEWYADDFIIVDFAIKNIGNKTIESAWAGLFYDGSIHNTNSVGGVGSDDFVGYIKKFPADFNIRCNSMAELVFVCDNSGNPDGNNWGMSSNPHGLILAPLRKPKNAWYNNFNWWSHRNNWGPRQEGTTFDPFRWFSGGMGRPLGDKAKYYFMSHSELDYWSLVSAIDQTHLGWLSPPAGASEIADGVDVQFVVSYGPFNLKPGETDYLTMMIGVAENIHTVPQRYYELFDPDNPGLFASQLNFDNAYTQLEWARAVFDNPGVDTDLDGDSGIYRVVTDPVSGERLHEYCIGDGIPDFRGASPPPPPPARIATEDGKIIVRWNGRTTENNIDLFSGVRDFEGYRVYLAKSRYPNDISVVASYDIHDYYRFTYSTENERFENKELPLTLDSLRAIYGESFLPDDYSANRILRTLIGSYYFVPVDYNVSGQEPHSIRKVYPDALRDTSDVDEQGRMRFYEYELVIDDLLQTIPYFVGLTTFDFGNPARNMEAMESSPYDNMQEVYAVGTGEQVLEAGKLNVYCYPNPYRVDGDYSERSLENRFTNLAVDRARIINFANLPNPCTITIYSLDGDLVKRIEHFEPEGSGTASVERFDLITRNTEAVVSGLYYWVVESQVGQQIGKLVIIR